MKKTKIRLAEGSELEKLRDVVIRCHCLSGGSYAQNDSKKLLKTIYEMTNAMIYSSSAMSGFLGRGGKESHRDILGGTGNLS